MAIIISFNVLAACFLLVISRRRASNFDARATRSAIQRCRSREETTVLDAGSDGDVAALYQSWLTPGAAQAR